MIFKLRILKNMVLRSFCKENFIKSLSKNSHVLDIGCGNISPKVFFAISNAKYYGIDITKNNKYFKGNGLFYSSSSHQFVKDIKHVLDKHPIDTILSNHNLEHCEDWKKQIEIIVKMKKIKRVFFAFPSSSSINLPKSKSGNLNFYQDKTHISVPDIDYISSLMKSNNWNFKVCVREYKPLFPYFVGFLWHPIFLLTGRQSPLYGTYSFLGFESVIWAFRD